MKIHLLRSGRRWLALSAAAVGLVALGPNAAQAPGADVPLERAVPARTVNIAGAAVPKLGLSALLTDLEVEAEVPVSFGGGPLDRAPEVMSDGREAAGKLASPLSASGNFDILQSFRGATLAVPGCGCEPPDTQLAVGVNEVVEAVNNDILVFDRDGTQLASFPATDIFQPPGQTVGLTRSSTTRPSTSTT